MPLVSVVIPTYNRRELVRRAILSVRAQTHKDIEIIVVDDGSTDGTALELRNDIAIMTISIPHAGASAARNAGVRQAKGEYIAFLDSDDEWEEDKIESQLSAMEKAGSMLSLSGARMLRDGKPLTTRRKEGALAVRDIFRVLRPISASCIMARRSLFDSVSFDENLLAGNDLDFLLRSRGKGDILSLSNGVASIHKSDKRPRISNDYKLKRSSYRDILKKNLFGAYSLSIGDRVEFAARLVFYMTAFFLARIAARGRRDRI